MSIKTYQAVLAAGALYLAGAAGAQGFTPIQFQMTATIRTDNRTRTEKSHIWMKAPDKFRIEQAAGARTIITIANGADLWQVDTLVKSCVHRKDAKTVRDMAKQTIDGVNLLDAFKKKGGRAAGRAKIDGVPCAIYRRTDKSGMKYTLWALPDGHIRRIETSGTLTGAATLGEEIQTHQVSSHADIRWLDNKSMPETLFRPPAGMQVREMPRQ